MPETNFDFSVLETIPDTDAEIEVPEEVLEGPQTEEEQGVASLILDAISNSANTIQMYNAIIANCTDEEIIDSLNEILVDENRIMGKLQSILKKVSPNAEEIMNGAIEDSGFDESLNESISDDLKEVNLNKFNIGTLPYQVLQFLWDLSENGKLDDRSLERQAKNILELINRNMFDESLNEGCNNQELINAVQSAYGYNKKEAKDYIKTIDDKSKEELLKGFKRNAKKSFLTDSLKESSDSRWDNIDIEDWSSEMNSKTYQIERSIKTVLKKYPESKTKIISTAKSCRNILSNLCSNLHLLYNESLNDLNEETTNPYGKAIPYQVSDELWRVRLSNRYKDLTEYDVWGYGSTTKPKDFYSEIAAEDAAAEYNQRYEDIEDELDESLSDREDIQNEIHRYNLLAPRYDKQSIIDELINDGYSYEEAEYIANHTTNLDESLRKDKKITRYSDVLSQKDRDRGWWYFTTHGVGPGTIPKDLNVLEVRDGQNKRGTWGTFVRLDGIVNTSELSYYDLTELAPPNVKNESLNESIAIKKNSTWIDTVGNDLCKVADIKEVERKKRNVLGSFKDTDIIVQYDDSPRKFTFSKGEFLVRFVPFRKSYRESINNESLSEYARENIDQFIRNYLEHHPFDSAEEMIDYLEEYGEIEELEDRFHTDVEAAIEDYFEYLNESLILDESNNLDTSLDDITPVRDEHNERAIRDHKKYKEDRKKAFKEISKNAKNAFELDESLFESFYLNYEDSDLLQDWDQGGLDFSVDIHPYKYEFYTSRDANKALKIAISHGYKDSWREGRYVYLTAH